ncbi:MAG: amidohydrolase family protein [Bacteroidota bacterium]
MAYRKLQAGRIFTGKYLLENNVLITTESGRVIDLVAQENAGDDIEVMEGILCPGFVNAHCHIELSHMKGIIPEHSGMVPFLMQVMFERQADEILKQTSIQNAINEMYAEGIVAVADICNTDDTAPGKAASQQMYFHNFIEASGFVPATAGVRFEQAIHTRNKFLHYFSPAQVSITPHAPYSVSSKLLEQVNQQAPALLTIHNQESQAEDDFIRNRNGELLRLYEAIGVHLDFFEPANTSSLQYFFPMLSKEAQLILVHNCFTTTADIAFLKQQAPGTLKKLYFCLCPNANLYIGNPLPLVSVLVQSGIPICVGTDSLASNNQLSILAELQTLQLHFPFIQLDMLLQWATINGANALQVENEFGSFDKGKKPGVLQLLNVGENNSLRNAVVNRVL